MSEKVLLRELYLVRHGESWCNVDGFETDSFVDKNDPELTENGLLQAIKLGEYRADEDYDFIFCSPLRRAVMTAVQFLGKRDQPLFVMPDLCEISVSPDYSGQTYGELKAYSPHITAAAGYENCVRTAIPDETPWENEERYFNRAAKVLEYLDRHFVNGEKVALVSHAGFLTYILFYLMGYRNNQPNYDIKLSNTSVTKISFYKPGTNIYGDMIIEYVNDTRHLDR